MKYTAKKFQQGDVLEVIGRVSVKVTAKCWVVVDENGVAHKEIVNGKTQYDQFNQKWVAEKVAEGLNAKA